MGHDVLHDLEALKRRREARNRQTQTQPPATPSKPHGKLWLAWQTLKLTHELRMKKSSWKTTLAGILAAAGAALSNSDNGTVHIIGQALTILGPILLGLAARDNGVTSEQAGAR